VEGPYRRKSLKNRAGLAIAAAGGSLIEPNPFVTYDGLRLVARLTRIILKSGVFVA